MVPFSGIAVHDAHVLRALGRERIEGAEILRVELRVAARGADPRLEAADNLGSAAEEALGVDTESGDGLKAFSELAYRVGVPKLGDNNPLPGALGAGSGGAHRRRLPPTSATSRTERCGASYAGSGQPRSLPGMTTKNTIVTISLAEEDDGGAGGLDDEEGAPPPGHGDTVAPGMSGRSWSTPCFSTRAGLELRGRRLHGAAPQDGLFFIFGIESHVTGRQQQGPDPTAVEAQRRDRSRDDDRHDWPGRSNARCCSGHGALLDHMW
jgi:hypothetical protein